MEKDNAPLLSATSQATIHSDPETASTTKDEERWNAQTRPLYSRRSLRRYLIPLLVALALILGGVGVALAFVGRNSHTTPRYTVTLTTADTTIPMYNTAIPRVPQNRPMNLTFKIHDTQTNSPVTKSMLQSHGGRTAHIALVGAGGNVLGHIHPEDFNANDEIIVGWTFQRLGKWGINFGYTLKGGEAAKAVFWVECVGDRSTAVSEPPLPSLKENWTTLVESHALSPNDVYTEAFTLDSPINTASNNTYRLALRKATDTASSSSSHCIPFIITFYDVANNPLTDMRLYLGAPAHIIITNPTLDTITHLHPIIYQAGVSLCGESELERRHGMVMSKTGMFGHELGFGTKLEKGDWRILVQVARGGDIIVGGFSVRVD